MNAPNRTNVDETEIDIVECRLNGESTTNRSVKIESVLAFYLRCPIHKGLPLAMFNKLFLTPASRGQCAIFAKQTQIVGAITWATLSSAVSEKLRSRTLSLEELLEQDLFGGSDLWVLDIVALGANESQVRALIALAKAKYFPSQSISYQSRRIDGSGQPVITLEEV